MNEQQETFLVTGTAGFIGNAVALELLKHNHIVIGIDMVNDYYDVNLKEERLKILKKYSLFYEERFNLADLNKTKEVFKKYRPSYVIHLAAQAGVRYSLENPYSYIESNILGQFSIFESCKIYPVKHLLFASTSSVYGANKKMPFAESDQICTPLSLYAATKIADEMIGHSYSHLFNIPMTVLRFFNVYGPWGRPDLAMFNFVKNMLHDQPINLHNYGKMQRDFTYIDDIVKGILLITNKPPLLNGTKNDTMSEVAPFNVYNIGNSKPVELMYYLKCIENELGMKAKVNLIPMQPGEVENTFANTEKLQNAVNYKPSTPIEYGVKKFVEWYREYYKI